MVGREGRERDGGEEEEEKGVKKLMKCEHTDIDW